MVTTIERTQYSIEALYDHPVYEEFAESELRPEVLVVPDMLTDHETRQRANRFIGMVMCHDVDVEVLTVQQPIESLHVGIKLAVMGDTDALHMVQTNARTDVIERTLKTGHVMDPVPLSVSEEGKVMQFGQTSDSIQANSLRFTANDTVMRARTEAETRNAFRIEELHQTGMFEEYSLVVLSLAENMPEAGFFTDTMSSSIQVTSKHGNGLAIESAFMSGIASTGAERHDFATVAAFGDQMGVDLSGKTAAEIIDTPLLIRNDLIPQGAIDVVRMLDDVNNTFFGEDKPRENYQLYREQCRFREKSFDPKVALITHDLLFEAATINSPVQAVQRLHKISEKYMVAHAVTDTTINPMVFGRVAARHIETARQHVLMGNIHEAHHEISEAQTTAQSYSCPSLIKSSPMGENVETTLAGSDKYGSLQFKCPKKGCVNTRKPNKLIKECQVCGADVTC